MPLPFPGMDSYIEDPEVQNDFHIGLTQYFAFETGQTSGKWANIGW